MNNTKVFSVADSKSDIGDLGLDCGAENTGLSLYTTVCCPAVGSKVFGHPPLILNVHYVLTP